MMSRRFYRVSAVFFALLALPPAYYAVMLPWGERVDFDIIGFLWIIQNTPKVLAAAIAIGFAWGAVVMGLRARWDV
jgi:hypothetical protein